MPRDLSESARKYWLQKFEESLKLAKFHLEECKFIAADIGIEFVISDKLLEETTNSGSSDDFDSSDWQGSNADC